MGAKDTADRGETEATTQPRHESLQQLRGGCAQNRWRIPAGAALTPAHNNAGNQLLFPAAWEPPGEKPLLSVELGPFPTTQSFPFPLSLGLSSGSRIQLLAKQQKEWWKGLGEADEAIPGEERHLLVVPSQMSCRQRPQAAGSLGAELRLQRQTDPDLGPSICH